MRPWEARDPAVAHVTVNADLADLLLPDLEPLIPTGDPADDLDADTTDGDTADVDPADEVNGSDSGVVADIPATADDDPTEAGSGISSAADTTARAVQNGTRRADEAVSDVEGTALPTSGSQVSAPPSGGSQVGTVGGLPVSPAAVRELLRRMDALGLTHPAGGHLAFTITGPDRRLLAVATPDELEAAARSGSGIGPPPAATAYRPTAAQYRYLRARDQHCRFPGCRRTALQADADHVVPYDHRNPRAGGQTCVRNLVLLCRRHHRLKTHAPGWRFAMDADGALHVTTPGGTTRVTRLPTADQVLDLLVPAPPPHDPAVDPPPF
jgi:hypothetical protein